MERKKSKVTESEDTVKGKVTKEENPIAKKLRWLKTGGGAFYLGNQIIKPGQTFEAHIDELPAAFMDTIQCLDTEELQKENAKRSQMVSPEITYKLKKVKGIENLWNVVNSEGKVLNETPYEEEAAKELLAIVSA